MQTNTVKKQRVPNSERRKASIKAVLDSALGLFVTQGYDATSMDDIASRAGLTKGAVYFYFKDKVSLLHALLERARSRTCSIRSSTNSGHQEPPRRIASSA